MLHAAVQPSCTLWQAASHELWTGRHSRHTVGLWDLGFAADQVVWDPAPQPVQAQDKSSQGQQADRSAGKTLKDVIVESPPTGTLSAWSKQIS